jgi:hypothetical protein
MWSKKAGTSCRASTAANSHVVSNFGLNAEPIRAT